ncbi:MAG: MFS transporter [Solirubrobacterales bacterium]|nr:MFS transporter [Solirubrobacterales bacterium]
MLFLVQGLGRSAAFASVIFAVVAVTAIAAALVGGGLADRVGFRRLVVPAVVVYGLGALVPALTQAPIVVVAIAPLAFAAARVMSLSFAWLARLTAHEGHGLAAGLYGLSQGAGIIFGPALAGIAVELARPVLPGTEGYATIFVVAAVAGLASVPFVARVPEGA